MLILIKRHVQFLNFNPDEIVSPGDKRTVKTRKRCKVEEQTKILGTLCSLLSRFNLLLFVYKQRVTNERHERHCSHRPETLYGQHNQTT